MMEKYIGKKVIIRAKEAGVFFGTLVGKDGQEVEIENCRRIWYWEGANSLSQLAVDGTAEPNGCKFAKNVESIVVMGVIEIIPCTQRAIDSIEKVKEWTV